MLRFEKALYENPDQDLNNLWWDLVEKYQGLHRPEGRNAPDYASKIHIVCAPVYYHNYMLGQLFACQVHRTIAREVLHEPNDVATAYYTKNPAVGTVHERASVRSGPQPALERADAPRHGRAARPAGVCGGVRGGGCEALDQPHEAEGSDSAGFESAEGADF